jgi:hypothetical protein
VLLLLDYPRLALLNRVQQVRVPLVLLQVVLDELSHVHDLGLLLYGVERILDVLVLLDQAAHLIPEHLAQEHFAIQLFEEEILVRQALGERLVHGLLD